jgi:hypothetical protein
MHEHLDDVLRALRSLDQADAGSQTPPDCRRSPRGCSPGP